MEETITRPLTILRRKEVQARTGIRNTAMYARIAEGTSPKQVRLGSRMVGWVEAEIEAWIADRIAESRSTS